MKTIDYVGFTTINQPLPTCPKCGQSSLRTIESKQSKLAQRRRKKCDLCNYRVTTHEVTDEFFQEAKTNQLLIQKLKKLFNIQEIQEEVQLPAADEIPCMKCSYNCKDHCSFGFPEYDTDDAVDCIHFKPNP